ncbi:hypothetical protein HY17_14235 [Hyphomonas sp. CY54-11-8]|nr:hypothetical protein HY17_14235 [Hyphomonas sp. CY54-11-8]RAN41877.1 hypothetical protein HY26_07395 [Hyphomonas sp. GM-8P]
MSHPGGLFNFVMQWNFELALPLLYDGPRTSTCLIVDNEKLDINPVRNLYVSQAFQQAIEQFVALVRRRGNKQFSARRVT